MWNLAKACRYYRKCGHPEVVLEITQNIRPFDYEAFSAILTTEGGALKDLKHFKEAIACANEAINYNDQSPHPYNLLGGIHFRLGNYQLMLHYFDKAIELGSRKDIQEKKILSLLLKHTGPIRNEFANYLYQVDPNRFRWASAFIS